MIPISIVSDHNDIGLKYKLLLMTVIADINFILNTAGSIGHEPWLFMSEEV